MTKKSRKPISAHFKPLRDVASVRMGYPFRSRLEHDPTGPIAVVQMKDLDDASALRLEGAVRVQLEDIKDRHLIKRGDLLFRSRGQTNSAVLVSADIGPAVLAAPLLLIRPLKVSSDYLYWYINLPSVQADLAANAEGTSVRMISKMALEALEVPIPSAREQQFIGEMAALVAAEQGLMERITQERKRFADGVLMRYARNSR